MSDPKRLLVCSEIDVPSVNMKDQLLRKKKWEEIGRSGRDRFLGCENMVIMITPDLHIYIEDIDRRIADASLDIDEVVFMSRHSAESGEASLTVHPIGNFHENKFGGKEKTLVKANPSVMTDALRKITEFNDLDDFRICFEVTHHGPWLNRPTFFIEIGSDARNWGNIRAAEILADTILNMGSNDYETAIGIAGGHYAPRFTEVALKFKINFGHMIPNYQIEGSTDEDILRMVKEASDASNTQMVYFHRKSLKGSEEKRLSDLIRSAGYELISSSDLDVIGGS